MVLNFIRVDKIKILYKLLNLFIKKKLLYLKYLNDKF